MKRSLYLVPAFLALALPACQTAPKAPPSTMAGLPDLLKPYDGALRILRHKGDERSVTIKAGVLPAGTCDLAVKIRSVAFEGGVARFSLESVGLPRVAEKRTRCRKLQPGLQLALTGFPGGGVTPEVTARIDEILQTPEAYLRSKGMAFDREAGSLPTEVASNLADGSDSERRLARSVTAWPRPLLTVDATYRDASGRPGHERLVAFESIVGTDGRLYKPLIKASVDRAHEAALQNAIALWRVEPARRSDGPLGARVAFEGVLRVYGK
jgi:hypothetical protein